MRIESLSDGVTAPDGFQAAGIVGGIKKNGRPDLALLFSTAPCAAAGIFTQNCFQAAPVRLTARRLASGRPVRAVIINSGNANACTGPQGDRDARETALLVAQGLALSRQAVLVASTGVIGEPLPMEKVRRAIPILIPKLSPAGGRAAAAAILTTDTRSKEIAVRAKVEGDEITVGGMAKGAGMIHPNMATLLAFVTTDAGMSPRSLQAALREATRESFNRISVDGETSTNDMVLLLANGRSGRSLSGGKAYRAFIELLSSVCLNLAEQVISDGEGATKRVLVRVEGARTESEAAKVAVAIVRSPLVKTAFFGEDANWGRILAAAGASGVDLSLSRISLYVEDTPLLIRGIVQGKKSEEEAATHLKERTFRITLNLGRGKASVAYRTCDLSLDYVRINAEYRS